MHSQREELIHELKDRGCSIKPEILLDLSFGKGAIRRAMDNYWGGSAEPLVPKAFADAAVETGKAAEVKPKPYHGYYFSVLQAQGPNAEGGRHNYMVKDSMIGGFGLVAWPAHYGVSGVHTFIVNQNGLIYEKDLGNPTASLSTTVTSYDPDKSWTRVQ